MLQSLCTVSQYGPLNQLDTSQLDTIMAVGARMFWGMEDFDFAQI